MAAHESGIDRKGVDDFIAAAAAKELLSIFGEGQAIEGFVDRGARDDFFVGEIDGNDFVLAVAGIKDGGVFVRGMNGDVDGKIAEENLLADGPEPPLIWQQHRTAGPLAGDIEWRLFTGTIDGGASGGD